MSEVVSGMVYAPTRTMLNKDLEKSMASEKQPAKEESIQKD